MLSRKSFFVAIWLAGFSLASLCLVAQQIGDGPVIQKHLDQSDIEANRYSFEELFELGRQLFEARFNTFDGQGRPAATGDGNPTKRDPAGQPRFIRTSSPDSNSCAGCHNQPRSGGAGDIVANVFVLAQVLDPVTDSVSGEFSNSRNTLGMFGAGAIEMLAREMTRELHEQREKALEEATGGGVARRVPLITKGVSFGFLTARPDGSVDASEVEGVNEDLIIRPFHQKGAVVSIREFTNNAFNHHHGMQAMERFGVGRTGTDDFDEDGVSDELTVGDVTATTIFQAALAIPGQVIPNDAAVARAILRGERVFSRVACDSCHRPLMILEDPVYSEPNPFHPEGNLQVDEVENPYRFDLTEQGEMPRLERLPDGRALVRAFTDLKRHNLCDDELDHYCNERLSQGGIATEDFLTRKLWDAGNSAPYGHVGDLTTLTEAIFFHGGAARASRDAFMALPQRDKDALIEFLKSLQVLPPGTAFLVVDEQGQQAAGPDSSLQSEPWRFPRRN